MPPGPRNPQVTYQWAFVVGGVVASILAGPLMLVPGAVVHAQTGLRPIESPYLLGIVRLVREAADGQPEMLLFTLAPIAFLVGGLHGAVVLRTIRAGLGTVSGAAGAIGLISLLASIIALLGALSLLKGAELGEHAGFFVGEVVAVSLPIGVLTWLCIWVRLRMVATANPQS